MKKILFAVIGLLAFGFSSQAQNISDHALGLRFGGGLGYGAEFSYQHKLAEANRLEFDLGFRSTGNFSAFKLDGIYQWVWNIEGGFDWYAGAGAGIGSVNDRRHDNRGDGLFALVVGNIGVDYSFDEVPIQIFLDFRPELVLASYDVYNNFGPDLAIGVRFRW